MSVRGAPAISIAGAYALAQAVDGGYDLKDSADLIISARPTAVDLSNAVQFVLKGVLENKDANSLAKSWENSIYENCKNICIHGADLIKPNSVLLTHCNTGPLATGKYGTALGAIIHAYKEGKNPFVFVDETRPRFQGALTSWELLEENIPHRIITDSSAAFFMGRGEIDAVLVGADRICKNGDFANKIGTYSLAVLAKHHNIPFYVLAPSSTFSSLETGKDIVLEQRNETEVLNPAGVSAFPQKTHAINYAFDITPAELVSAYITEKGISKTPPR